MVVANQVTETIVESIIHSSIAIATVMLYTRKQQVYEAYVVAPQAQ